MQKRIYLDGAANTPLDKKVYRAMKPFLASSFVGNGSAIHSHGIDAAQAIEVARDKIANCLDVLHDDVYFTSGATESNNWIIQSLFFNELTKPIIDRKDHLIVSAIEHSSILSTCRFLEKLGFSVTYIQPSKSGKINVTEVGRNITSRTLLISVIAVNNETGVANDIERIGKLAHKHNVLMMSDCTQALSLGGDSMKLGSLYPDVDYFTFSTHKLYGPTGVGCLIVNSRNNPPLFSYMYGGGQEHAKRGGTYNTAGIVGTGEAVQLMSKVDYSEHYKELYNYTLDLFKSELNGLPKLNVIPTHYNIMNVDFSKMFSFIQLAAMFALQGVSCSAGSACDAEKTDVILPSHVLTALGIKDNVAANSVRISFTKYTTKKDIKQLIKSIKALRGW